MPALTCCLTESIDLGAFEEVPFDIDGNGQVDLTDLSILLSCFGSNPCAGLCCRADLNCDNVISLQDLTLLLSRFGLGCTCPPQSAPPPSIAIQPWDTGYLKDGSFAGEVTHFVFDVLVQINTADDDWIGSGVVAAAVNDAAFRLVPNAGNPPTPGAAAPDKYATFYSVPYAVNANNRFNNPFPSGGIVGKYDPTGTLATYTTTALNAAWYDTDANSNDGPAAILRLVIDVSKVAGANTSGGLGSVYFTAGSSSDIRLADITVEVRHKYADSATITTGAFYVAH